MKGSRVGILLIGLAILAIELALVFVVLPESYRTGSVAWINISALVFGTALLFGLTAYGAGMDKNRGDLPAWIASPFPAMLYLLAVGGVYAITPILSPIIAIGIHLVLLAILVLVGGALVVGAGHLAAEETEDRVAENGYQQMMLAGNAATRALQSNAAAGALGEVSAALNKLVETIQYSDRGGLSDTVDLEQDITNDLRGLSTELVGLSEEQSGGMATRIQLIANKVAERRDLLKMKK